MNRQVNITKRVTVDGELRYCPVVEGSNGKIRPDAVMVNGTLEKHPEGAYYIEWRDNGKRIRLSVGKDAAEARNARMRKEAELNATNNGVAVVVTKETPTLADAVADYLEDIKNTHKPKTFAAYSTALQYFLESCHKLNVGDVDRKDLLRFSSYLRDAKEQSARTQHNKFGNVLMFLKSAGARGLVGKNDWPKYVEEEPDIYEKDELVKLFAACDAEEKLWFEFFLKTGMREQEVQHAYWTDVNFSAGVVRVTHKPDRGWTPKQYKERSMPLDPKLAEELKAWRTKTADKNCNLLFPTSGCKPKLDFLKCVKAVAERAGLDPDDCWLHKFRATFATTCLRGGLDLATVQKYMGHSDLASTMRYLKPAGDAESQTKFGRLFA